MLGDVPSDLIVLKSIQLSFAKIAQALNVFESRRQLFNHINMATRDLIFNHNMHQCRYHSIVADLKQLRKLQTQKSTYTSNFQAVEEERQTDLLSDKIHKKRD
ncbi:hypothetical protein AAZV13_19G049300 [Glycine max]